MTASKGTKKTESQPLPSEQDFKDLANEPMYVTVKGEVFKVRALAMGEIPKLARLIERMGEIEQAKGASDFDEGKLRLMAQIIRIGVKQDHPDLSVEKIMQKFPLGAFPDFLVAVMDTNDFFGKMTDYYRMAAGQQMMFGFPNISDKPPDDSDS